MQCSRPPTIKPVLYAVITAGILALFGVMIPALAAVSVPARPTTNAMALPEEPLLRGSMLIELMGFGEPEFRGLTTVDGAQHPIFRARAVNNEPVDLLVYTGPNGGLELRLARTGQRIASADHLAYEAQMATLDWRDTPDPAEATMVNVASEPTRLKAQYTLLAQYTPTVSYWFMSRRHVEGWPNK